MTIPLLDAITIQRKSITIDVLLTQRKIDEYMVNREADYHFITLRYRKILLQVVAHNGVENKFTVIIMSTFSNLWNLLFVSSSGSGSSFK